ncbi:hybrid sensor histidine kinase/response regulator [Runella slithyformis]|uniref:Response regulator receiver sensor signal transduction histidine kinase n=1 Tax=Runella slithyformis (strain ATCC 29530 / DSM 19594 / LMG 11500 / NCIMB 11436 / LSU 4) TaxID=761193 RepID=A0A7U4E8R8_RUNSL|nr:response regulator [Runella slithyformis]AEI51729.1 response regulator receiver sensor signal transduction histidine kinase [Runella slithyformis DSM 19594]
MIIKVLIIEDEDAIRENIAEMLSISGFKVETAANGREGLSQTLVFKPDVIICDIMMPLMNGYQVLETLRSSNSQANTPFIFLTSMANPAEIREGMLIGADDYLTKPFNFSDLIAAIESRLKREKLRKEELNTQIKEYQYNLNKVSTHEYNTPLSSMLGFLNLLSNHYSSFDKEETLSMLELITLSCTRLKKTLDNSHLHLLLQKLEPTHDWYKQYTTGCTVIDEKSLKEMASSLAHQYETAFVRKTSFRASIETATISISEANLKKAVEELIENAFKFSDDNSCVEITGKRLQDNYQLTIINQGREFHPDHIRQIGPYLQFEREKYEQQGLGLGLWIAQKLITLNKGQLTIGSHNGHTCITVLFGIME